MPALCSLSNFTARRTLHFHGTRSYGVCRRLLPDRAGPGEQDGDSDGSRRAVHSGNRFFILRQRRRARRLGPGSRRRRSASRKHSQHTLAGHRGYRGTRSCALTNGEIRPISLRSQVCTSSGAPKRGLSSADCRDLKLPTQIISATSFHNHLA